MGKTPPGNHLGTRRGLLFLPSGELEGPGIEVAESLRQRFAGLPLSHPTDPYGLTVVESYSSSLALAFALGAGAAGLGAGAGAAPSPRLLGMLSFFTGTPCTLSVVNKLYRTTTMNPGARVVKRSNKAYRRFQ